jgi:ABC-type transport system substrate-binding protein
MNTQLKDDLKTANVLTTNFTGFNLRRDSIFAKDKDIRKAINYGVNKEKIIKDVVNGLADEAKGIFPPAIIDNSYLNGFKYNPNKAKDILTEKGFYATGEKLVILARKEDENTESTNEKLIKYIIDDMKNIGVDCEVVRVPSKEYMNPNNISKCDIYIMGWIADTGDPDNYLQPLFNPNNYTNFGGYDNPEVTKLMENAKKIINPEKRMETYKNIQDIIIDDCPWIFLYHPKTAHICKKDIENLKLSSLGKVRYDEIIITGY